MNPQEYLFNQLAQEAVEVAHAVSKALCFGLEDKAPGQALTNAQHLQAEVLQLGAVWRMLLSRGLLPTPPESVIEAACQAKEEKVLKYLRYSQTMGITSSGEV